MGQVVFSEKAAKEFRNLPQVIQKRVKIKLFFWSQQKNPLQFARKLVGAAEFGEYRYRVGDYRILCDYSKSVIHVLKIGHRKEIYR